MRRISKKRQRINRAAAPVRDEYRDLFPVCQIPGCRDEATELHEIARGVHRKSALAERCALLHLCRGHHLSIHYGYTLAQQYALKLFADPDGFDLVRLNRLRGRSDDAITIEEIQPYVEEWQ